MPVTGTPRGDRAPCSGDPNVCGGSCDGSDAKTCKYQPKGKVCERACSDGSATSSACDGSGSCVSQKDSTSCGAYACGKAACLTSCAADADCSKGSQCVDSRCAPPPGLSCSSDLSASLSDADTVQCQPYSCDQSTGACRGQCSREADCSPGNGCDPSRHCAPPVTVTAPSSNGDSQSSRACGCRLGARGPSSGAAFATLLLLGLSLRRARRAAPRSNPKRRLYTPQVGCASVTIQDPPP
jgi:hypothetical protein